MNSLKKQAISVWVGIGGVVAVSTFYIALPEWREPLRYLWITSELFFMMILILVAPVLLFMRLVPRGPDIVIYGFKVLTILVLLGICLAGLHQVFLAGDIYGFIMTGAGLGVFLVSAWCGVLWPQKEGKENAKEIL